MGVWNWYYFSLGNNWDLFYRLVVPIKPLSARMINEQFTDDEV